MLPTSAPPVPALLLASLCFSVSPLSPVVTPQPLLLTHCEYSHTLQSRHLNPLLPRTKVGCSSSFLAPQSMVLSHQLPGLCPPGLALPLLLQWGVVPHCLLPGPCSSAVAPWSFCPPALALPRSLFVSSSRLAIKVSSIHLRSEFVPGTIGNLVRGIFRALHGS